MGIGNRRVFVLAASAAVLMGVASRAPLPESVLAAAPARPAILAAQVDRVAGTLTIQGQGLGGPAAQVTLGGALLEVSSATEQTIVAVLPADAGPGSLLLTVSAGNRADSFAVTIPASAIVTPDGITIESTGADVRIITGTSRITVDPSGGIRIESDGALDVRTTGALALRGRTVNIASEMAMTLNAGTTLTLDAAATTNVRAAGTVAVTGALVTLN